jgi:hypothetical protein
MLLLFLFLHLLLILLFVTSPTRAGGNVDFWADSWGLGWWVVERGLIKTGRVVNWLAAATV